MIIVKVELWPGGDEARAAELGRLQIANEGTHPAHPRRGDYMVRLMRKNSRRTVLRTANVKDYPRLSYPVWRLVRRALEALDV